MSILSLRKYRFLIGVALLLAVNVALSFLLWRQLRVTAAPPPLPTPVVPALASPLPPTATAPVAPDEPAPSPTPLPDPTSTPPAPSATPAATAAAATSAPLPPVAPPTATQPATVSVAVGTGLNLRDSPDGAMLDTLPFGEVVTLLPGREEIGGTVWQEVRTEDGRTGWVAAEFLDYSE